MGIRVDDFARAQQLADALRPDDLHRLLDAYVKVCCPVLETTTNDVFFFKHHRKVEHKNGTETRELAPLKKAIYSLIDLWEILLGCNRRYLEFLSSLDDHSEGQRALQKLTEPRTDQKTTWRGFNFFATTDQALLRAVLDPISLIVTAYVVLI